MGVVEVAAGVTVVVPDTATAEVAGAEMVAAAVMVAVSMVCKVLYKDTTTVKIRVQIHFFWGGVAWEGGPVLPVWLTG